MAIPTNSLISDHLHADKIECLLAGIIAHALSVSRPFTLDDVSLLTICHGDIDQPNGLIGSAAARARDAGHPYADRSTAALPDPFRQCFRDLLAHSSILGDESCGH